MKIEVACQPNLGGNGIIKTTKKLTRFLHLAEISSAGQNQNGSWIYGCKTDKPSLDVSLAESQLRSSKLLATPKTE